MMQTTFKHSQQQLPTVGFSAYTWSSLPASIKSDRTPENTKGFIGGGSGD